MVITKTDSSVLTRRTAIARLTGVLAGAMLVACDTELVAPDRDVVVRDTPFKAFTFLHDDSVHVVVSEHDDVEKFTLTIRKDGEDVETFEGLNDKTVGSVQSALVQVSYIDVPTG